MMSEEEKVSLDKMLEEGEPPVGEEDTDAVNIDAVGKKRVESEDPEFLKFAGEFSKEHPQNQGPVISPRPGTNTSASEAQSHAISGIQQKKDKFRL